MASVKWEAWGVIVNATDTKSIKWEYYEQLYAHKFN